MKIAALAMAVALVAANGRAAEQADWMKDEGGVLEMMLAHEEKGAPDGGILRIDRAKKTVTWEGVPGEVGCKLKVESSFDSVKSVKDNGQNAGFVLELKEGKTKRLTLLPLPYAQWFIMQWKASEGKFGQTLPEGTLATGDGRRGEGQSMGPSGSAAGGPSLKHVDIPELVSKDTKKAISAALEALGRGGK